MASPAAFAASSSSGNATGLDAFMAVPGQQIHPTGLTPTIHPEFTDPEQLPTLQSLLIETAQTLADSLKQSQQLPAQTTTTTKSTLPSLTAMKQAQLQSPRPPPHALISDPQAMFANPKSQDYLGSLLSMPLPALQQLPNSLTTLSTSLDNDLSSLAFTRYSSFLLAHEASQAIITSFSTLSTSLDQFISSTDDLKSVVSSFERTVAEPKRKRERMALVRERMEEVEELLEAPTVVDACVRAGYWAEAIDRNLKLPGAIRGIGILRRIGERGLGAMVGGNEDDDLRELDEDGLRIVFLAARWKCLKAELALVEAQMSASGIKLNEGATARYTHTDEAAIAEENEERTRWAKRWIEVWREIVGETIGMYTELFLPASPLNPSITKTAKNLRALPPAAPLALFLTTSLTNLADTFAAVVPALVSTASLSSLLTQLSYCSHSFARYGFEFREIQQLRERVEARVGRIVVSEWEQAGRRWEKEWRDGWEGGAKGATVAAARRIQLLGGRAPISDWLVVPEGLSQVFNTPEPERVKHDETRHSSWHHQPPPALALLPPLARFLNTHAMALNSLRLLPPLSLYPQLLIAQARELDRATQVLAAFADAWLSSSAAHPVSPHPDGAGQLSQEEVMVQQIRDDERRLITFAIEAFGRWVVPWLEGALKVGVYGEVSADDTACKFLGLKLERQDGIVNALKRAELLVARIEGREPVGMEDETGQQSASQPTLPHATNTEQEHAANEPVGGLEADEEPSSSLPAVDLDAPIEDLPVKDMPLVNPPEELSMDYLAGPDGKVEQGGETAPADAVHVSQPAVEVEAEQQGDAPEDDIDEGWGISGDVADENEP
ncbi:hypothetical protein OIO90_000713 [Microbotryomycetes sp. JL221]|nr:hypothetical protein OIO90_000713 [Microbotryomycetes sp. JL221]